MFYRVFTLVRKELQALMRDPQGRVLLVAPVVLQLVIFSSAATLEVKNNTLALLINDHGAASAELSQRLSRAAAFSKLIHLRTEAELKAAIDNQEALIALRFDDAFSRNVENGTAATIQAVLDGRRSNSAQVALGYVRQVVQDWAAEKSAAAGRAGDTLISVRHWYNPNLDFVRHIIPSLVAIITAISALVVTGLSVAREREQGTFDQLLVSPLTPGMIMTGKIVPALVVAAFQASIILAAGVFVFGIPFRGSLFLLYGSMLLYTLSLAGIGLLISSICRTQQQAFLGVFSFLMPAVLLSGFPSPVENMPQWLQWIDWFNPLRHFIVIVKGVFLKGVGMDILWRSVWPLVVIAAISLTAADVRFRRGTGT